MFSLKEKNAVVTGAGSGIGKAVALLLAKQGARVYAVDLNEEQALETVKEIEAAGGAASAHAADVSKQSAVQEVYASIPKVDIVVNSAGVSHVGTVETTPEADFDRLYNVNVKGVYNSLYAAVPLMKKNGGGVIVNMSSIAALVGIPDRFAYSMTKGAVTAMTLSVAKDYIHDGIRCNCISPARVHTPFVDNFIAKNYPGLEAETMAKLAASQPMGRMGTPDEIAKLALFLCSDAASFITGSDVPIDGGFQTLR